MNEDLAKIKLAMAEKYERLARSTKSDPKRKAFRYRANRQRRIAAQLLR